MTVVAEANPTVARRRLAVYFRRLREQHGVSLEALAKTLDVNYSHASRLDTGARGFQAEDVLTLARLYKLTHAERAPLLTLAEEARKRAWWQQYELKPALRTMIGMEQAARSIGEYAGSVIPGLLQTSEYARASFAAALVDVPRQTADDVVTVRMRRQQVLNRQRPPELWVVIDEAALARVAGGTAVMRHQLEHILVEAEKPHVTVQVIGFEYGIYPGGGNHFILLGMDEPLPDVLYRESLEKHSDTADGAELQSARKLWDVLRALALSPRDSAKRITKHLDQLHD